MVRCHGKVPLLGGRVSGVLSSTPWQMPWCTRASQEVQTEQESDLIDEGPEP